MENNYVGRKHSPYVLMFSIVLMYLFVNNLWFWAQQPGAPNLLADASEWRTYFGQGDAGSYLMVALDLVGDFSIASDNRWALQLWPPGMPILEWIIILVFGPKSITLALAFLTSALWSTVIVLFFKEVADRLANFNKGFSSLSVIIVFTLLPVFTWTGQSFLFNSEPIGLALFSIAIIKLWPILVLEDSHGRRYLKQYVQSGFFIGAASYFRAPFFLLGIVIMVVLLIHKVITYNWMRMRKRTIAPHFGSAVLLSASFCIVVAPWLIISSNTIRPGIISWTQSDDLGTRAWINKSDPSTPAWYASSGPGWACDIAPKECAQLLLETPGNEVLQKLAIRAIVYEPLKFISNRAEYFFRASFIPISGTATLLESLLNLITITFLPVAFFLQLVRRKFLASTMVLVMVVALILPPTLYHFEPRYLGPMKFFGVLLLMEEITRQIGLKSKKTCPKS